LFHNLRLQIFIYYLITVTTFLTILYYFLIIIELQNILLLTIILLCFVILSGVMISKLSIDPLSEHISNLQNLSKETLHELNLPVSVIMTNTQLIRKNTNDAKALKRLDRISKACSMLQLRYNELDYMIKTQTLQEINEIIKLDELVEERIEFLSTLYTHVKFNLELDSVEILNDKIGLSKVIDNLIDNGVKYSPNSDKIDIKLKDSTLLIQDYGCGMDEVELVQIFDRYYQSNENMQGFGIGLNMVKKFCDKNNIALNFKSKPNFGTTVSLNFK